MYRCMNRTSIYQTLEINQAQWYVFPFPIPRHSCALIKGEVFFFLNEMYFWTFMVNYTFKKPIEFLSQTEQKGRPETTN